MRFIHVSQADLTEREIAAAVKVLRSGWLTMGSQVEAFEKELKATIGAKEVVAVNACTSALHLSLLAAGVSPGGEVLTSPLTFTATANAILYCGAKPIFCDIEPHTGNLDPSTLEEKITEKTQAILPIHFAGHPCDLNRIRSVAKKWKLPVIEDAAHALGAKYANRLIGADSDFCCFSFYAAKNLTTIEGGAMAFRKKSLLPLFQKLRLHGLSRTAWKRYAMKGRPTYRVEELGFKYNLNDVGAAIGRVQLSRYATLQKRRRTLAQYYLEHLASLEELTLPSKEPYAESAWHIFIVKLKRSQDRPRLLQFLQERAIGSAIHFPVLHLEPLYKKRFGFRRGLAPHAEDFASRCLTLPLHPAMTSGDAHRVVQALRRFFSH